MRFQPHDTSTEDGRAAERHRRIFWSASASIVARGTGFLAIVGTIPVTLRYLGQERYGMLMTMASIILVFTFADFGLGSGLMTSLAHARGSGTGEHAHRLISTGFYALVGVAAALTSLVVVAGPLVPWQRLYNVTSAQASAEAWPATATLLGCQLLLLPLSIAEEVRTGRQSGFTHSLWVAIANAATVAGTLLAIHLHAGLPWLVLALGGTQTLACLLSFVSLFFFEEPALRPSTRALGTAEWRLLRQTGVLFLVLDVSALLVQASDNFIISQLLGASAVAAYSVAARLFSIAPIAIMFLTNPLWPAYGEAIARGDTDWVQRTLFRSVTLVGACSTGVALLLVAGSRWFIGRWISAEMVPPAALILGLATWSVIQSVSHTSGMLLNGARVIRVQIVIAVIAGIGAIAARIVLTRIYGTPGVVWGTVIAYVPLVLLPTWIFIPRFLRGLGTRGVRSA